MFDCITILVCVWKAILRQLTIGRKPQVKMEPNINSQKQNEDHETTWSDGESSVEVPG